MCSLFSQSRQPSWLHTNMRRFGPRNVTHLISGATRPHLCSFLPRTSPPARAPNPVFSTSPKRPLSTPGHKPSKSNKMEVRCQCGAVSFHTPTAAPLSIYHCHCTECQKQSSSAFGTSAIYPATGLFPLAPELREKLGCWTRPSKEGRTMDCYFCKACGVRMFHRIREADGTERETVSIKGGAVQGLSFEGAKHIYVESAVVPIPEGAERWETTPDVMEGREGGN